MTEFRADLHCHSNCSDGSDSPERLVEKAIELGLGGLAVTDHDTIEGCLRALACAEIRQFPLLSGVEFSSAFQNQNVHILGYAFSIHSLAIQDLCQKHITRRNERNSRIISKLRSLGLTLSIEELESRFPMQQTLGRPHIAVLLEEKGLVKSVKEAFDKYLGDNKAAYEPGERISINETIEAIHKGGGYAILAHPHLMRRRVVREVLKFPFDGIEGYYARCHPSQEEIWIREARKRGWIVTGGSDYHGTVKPESHLGSSWVGKETFDLLYERFLSHGTLDQ